MWTVLNQLREPGSLSLRNMFLILEGFFENGQGKVEHCMLNSLLQKQKSKGWEKPGETRRARMAAAKPTRPARPRLHGRRGKGRSAPGLALVKMSPVRFHSERRFYLPFPQPLSRGYWGWARRLLLGLPAWLDPNEVCAALGCKFSISFLLLQSCCSEVQTSLITWQNLSAGIQKGRCFILLFIAVDR